MARFRGPQTAAAGVVALGLFAVGFGTAHGLGDESGTSARSDAAASTSQDAPADEDWYESTLELSDGGRVHVRLVEGTGVQERHRAAGAQEWSSWKTLYKSKEDRCQGVELEEVNGTVSLIADFGLYCSDGEPPQESVAAVGTGDLTKWAVDMTEGFDGWQDVSIRDDGSKVLFINDTDSGLYTLGWDIVDGFGKMSNPRD
ncbi:hypothetical protein MTQ01_06040 [Streptomyces sp. XM4193]|uniref:hypothetical protein n=1 Tax=Streptomyces sp. XM4193 TaxID=2929782 RepID=UPI001FFBA3C7|nr:hypothetical protein [Streptomyces sp. XM4193]MCK1795575.1 hypothetical protein [Streptomyces sp. XM4193]